MTGRMLQLSARRALKAAAAELGDVPFYVVVGVADRRGLGGVAVDSRKNAPGFDDDEAARRAFVEAAFCAARRAFDEAGLAKRTTRALAQAEGGAR